MNLMFEEAYILDICVLKGIQNVWPFFKDCRKHFMLTIEIGQCVHPPIALEGYMSVNDTVKQVSCVLHS